MIAFKSEADLLKVVLDKSSLSGLLAYENTDNHLFIEPKGLFGIPDLVFANVKNASGVKRKVRTFAFELKLRNWKRALMQAYRYRAFANRSYVVLDRTSVDSALDNIASFKRSDVGLVSIDLNGIMELHYQPKYEKPFSDQLCSTIERLFGNNTLEREQLHPQTSRTDCKSEIWNFSFTAKQYRHYL